MVTLAIAVHNIPEGLAVSMVLASRGVSPQKAMLWSVITSLPQVISFDCGRPTYNTLWHDLRYNIIREEGCLCLLQKYLFVYLTFC